MPSRTTTTTTADGVFRIESTYSWGGNMDHTETLVTCLTCGWSEHSDFGPFDTDDEGPHGPGNCIPPPPPAPYVPAPFDPNLF